MRRVRLAAFLVRAGTCSAGDHALASLLTLNGLRISEVLGADVDDTEFERGHRTVKIVRKGGKHAVIPLAPRTPLRMADSKTLTSRTTSTRKRSAAAALPAVSSNLLEGDSHRLVLIDAVSLPEPVEHTRAEIPADGILESLIDGPA